MPQTVGEPPADLGALYWGEQYNLHALADEYDVSDMTVRQWMETKNIERRVGGNRPLYWPFEGDADAAKRLLTRREDLLIRFISDGGSDAYKLYAHNGTLYTTRKQNPPREVTSDAYLSSLFETYESRLSYRDTVTTPSIHDRRRE